MAKTSFFIDKLYEIITFSDTYKKYSGSDVMSVYRDYFLERLSEEKAKNICDLDGYINTYTLIDDIKGEIYTEPAISLGNQLCELFIESALPNKGTLTASFLIETVKKHIIEQEKVHHYISSFYDELLGNLPSPYRTRLRAGDDIAEMPDELYTPIGEKYEYALSFYHNRTTLAHMEIAEMTDNLEFKDGILMIKGMPASRVELINYQTKEGVDSVDLMLLRTFFSFMLSDAEEQLTKNHEVNDTIKVYAPSILKYTGRDYSFSPTDFQGLLKGINAYQNVYGSLKSEDGKSETFYQVLNVSAYNPDDNTLEVSSPYMSNIIQNIYEDRISTGKVSKKAIESFDINEIFETTTIIKREIGEERSKVAVEIVYVIVRKILQAKKGAIVKISVKELFNMVPQLQFQIFDKTNPKTGLTKSTRDKNKALKRIFKRVWELIREKTDLEKEYPGMVLPDPNLPSSFPTVNDMDKEFAFDTAVAFEDDSSEGGSSNHEK